jgi:hypothetical protein
MLAQIVVFSASKEGYAPGEWEDGAAAGPVGAPRDRDSPRLRFAVADGATETYESGRWVNQLIESFMSPDQAGRANRPELERASMSAWFAAMQKQWLAEAPAASDYIEEMKIRQGTLATFVGCQILNLDTPTPVWQGAALGDSVLFHVRGETLIDQFPRMRSSDFASSPEGISTLPERLGRMSGQVQFRQGGLAAGDMIFVATDAFAKWMITRLEARDEALWPRLSELDHPIVFDKLVAAERRAGTMKDDDVTLMRIRLLEQPPSTVLVCQ